MPTIPATPPAERGNAADQGCVRLYSVKDAADMLGVSRYYVYDHINDGQIRAVNLGEGSRDKLRVRADDLQAFIDARTPEAKAS